MFLETDLAYAAGIVDGEGSIIIHKCKPGCPKNRGDGRKPYPDKTPRFTVDVRVSMTDKLTVDWFKVRFGGHITTRKDERKPQYRTMYHWGLRANKAITFVKLIKPYLITKAHQAELIIHFQENIIRKSGWKGDGISDKELAERNRLYEINKLLNRGGSLTIMGGHYDC